MKVFVTGATGYIGSAVARELVAAGHEVTGLTRSPEKGPSLESLGATPVVGDLAEPETYRAAARSADALVHLAAEESGDRVAVDGAAVDTLLAAAGNGGPGVVVYTSGCFVLGDTGDAPAHEDAPTSGAPELVAWRPAHEARVLAANTDEVATAVIRPGMVYGGADGTFAMFFRSAEEEGVVEYIGDGANRWSPVYREDVARLYRMVLEHRARGIYHCAEPAARVRDLAAAAARAAGADGIRPVPVAEAREALGAFADALTLDQVVGCRRAAALGWAPEHLPFPASAEAVYREFRAAA